MTQQVINIGAAPNDRTGDPARTAFDKCNLNFTELYNDLAVGTAGTNAFTTVAAPFTIPPVGSSVNVQLVEASWIALGQMLWIETAGGPGTAALMLVTAIAGNTVTLLNGTSIAIPGMLDFSLAGGENTGLMVTLGEL